MFNKTLAAITLYSQFKIGKSAEKQKVKNPQNQGLAEFAIENLLQNPGHKMRSVIDENRRFSAIEIK